MSEINDDAVTIVIGDESVSQDLTNEDNETQNPMVLKIIKKQHILRNEIIRIEAKLEVLNELIIEHIRENIQESFDDNDNDDDHDQEYHDFQND